MKLSLHPLTTRAVCVSFIGAALSACGGAGSSLEQTPVSASIEGTSLMASSTYVPQSRGTATPSTPSNPTAADAVTDVRFENTASAAQTNVPVTFGQVFSPGHLASGASLVGRLDSGATVPLQIDVKAKHADGSVRHAIISAVLPSLPSGATSTMSLLRSSAAAQTTVTPTDLLNAGFTASFNATVNGVRYSASADQLLKSGKANTWLAGANANEWQVSAPLTSSSGAQHPHLTARFAIRWYQAAKKARVDVVVENNWAFEQAPSNFTYDADLIVGGKSAYAKSGLTHVTHARWRKLAWWGGTAPEVHVKHNTAYLIATRAVPNYDQSLSIPENVLNGFKKEWTGAMIEPMSAGAASGYMPMTGARRDIGLLPSWTVSYLLSMDKRAAAITLGAGDLAGSFPTHYRDKLTGHPVSLVDYPAMSVITRWEDTWNPATNRHENFPNCAGPDLCNSPYTPDTPHQPNLAYVPYLVTGDYYYLEELQFWGMWSVMASHPGYRGYDKALVASDQLRGQAWTLRTLAETAYISPDAHPLKSHFVKFVDANLDWFNTTYANGASSSNQLGVITNGYSVGYIGNTGLAPWQDDFFTSVIGHALELGFTKAEPLLRFKVRFPIDRMTSPAGCWNFGAEYAMKIRDTETSPFYTSYAKVYSASKPEYLGMACNSSALLKLAGLKTGEIAGIASSAQGQPAILQPALAYAADIGGADGKKAWAVFEARSVKPDYDSEPQYAIKPRQ